MTGYGWRRTPPRFPGRLRLSVVAFMVLLGSACAKGAPEPWAPDPALIEEARALNFSDVVLDAMGRDLPSAVVRLKAVADHGEPSAAQAEWLRAQLATMTPAALAILQRVHDDACAVRDLRTAIIARTVSSRIQENARSEEACTPESLWTDLIAGQQALFYFQVSDVSGRDIGESYVEGSFQSEDSLILRPREGTRLIEVSATVSNISNGMDAPYFVHSFPGMKGGVEAMLPTVTRSAPTNSDPAMGGGEVLAGPLRWLDDTLVFLLDADGNELIACLFMPRESELRRGDAITHIIRDREGGIVLAEVITQPKPLRQGEQVRFVGLFSVPDAATTGGYRLLVLGAAPTAPIAIAAATAN